MPAAIAYGRDTVSFSAVDDTASGRLTEGAGGQQVTVPATTLGKLLADAPPGPFALVCDIEGAEFEVFTHEDESVRDPCALAVMELHEVVREGKRYDRAALADYLCARWKMRILFSDGKVWVLGRA